MAARRSGSGGGWRAPCVLLLAACSAAPTKDDAPSKDKEPTSSSELATSTGDDGPPQTQGDLCVDGSAIAVGLGTHEGTLFNAAADLAAALDADAVVDLSCAFDGPDVFLHHTVSADADVTVTAQGEGFVPMLAILDGGCTTAFACTTGGLSTTMLDVSAGTTLAIAVGIAADADVLATAMSDADLRYRVEIRERAVIGTGESCGLLGQGRCESGSACQPDELGGSRCTAVPGDTCTSATEVVLGDGATTVNVDPAVPYSDAHRHPCAGARRRDRVLHVQWPAPGGTLRVSTTATDVALAVRGPGCAVDEALACATPESTGTRVEVPVSGPGGAFVFVELPIDDPEGDGSELGPFDVELAVVP